ncbi:MAG: amidohydrolase family protein [Candidatus Woykebacteria bacterium]
MRVKHLDLKEDLMSLIRKNGGFVNAHAHLDRAFTLNKENLIYVNRTLQEKWGLCNELKRRSTVMDIYDRMAKGIELMISQNVQAIGTFIDVDKIVKDKSIKAAQKIRDKYGKDINIKYINQIHYGVLNNKAREWFDIASEFVDIIGGLPERDKGKEKEHIDILLGTAKSFGKMAHVHIDQFNSPSQRDTEILVRKVIEHKMEGRVAGIHVISLAAQPAAYRKKIYNLMKKAEFMVISAPIAWIDSKRTEELSPTHSSITPVDELVPYGIPVALGTDNIYDIYKPFASGNMWEDLHLMIEACRYYNIEDMANVATKNGLKVLGL